MSFKDLKLQNLAFAKKLKSAGLIKLGNKIAACSTIIDTKIMLDNKNVTHNVNRCKNRFCPICAKQRQLEHTHKVSELLTEMSSQGKSIHAAFLTFTIANCSYDELGEKIDELKATWSKITRQKFFKNIIQGYIYYVDITFKADGSCHPHLHTIIFFKNYNDSCLSTVFWQKIWQKTANLNYKPQVKSIQLTNTTDIIKRASYSMKPLILSHINSNILASIICQLSHKRLFAISKTIRHYIPHDTKKLDIDTIDQNYLLAKSIWSKHSYILLCTDNSNYNNNYPLLQNSS